MSAVSKQLTEALDLVSRRYKTLVHEGFKNEFVWQRERTHLITLLERSPELREVAEKNPESLARVVQTAGAMQLTLNPTVGHCYIICRRARKRRQGEPEDAYKASVPLIADVAPSYMGLADLAIRADRVAQVAAEVVFQGDSFKYRGPFAMPEHDAVIDPKKRTEKHAIGVYAAARMRERYYKAAPEWQSTFIDADTVQKIRSMSERPNATMWVELWTEGWKKTAVRRLFKLLPKTPSMFAAQDAMDRVEGMLAHDEPPAPKEEEIVRLVDAGDLETIRKQLTDGGISGTEQERWIDRLKVRFQVADLSELPKAELPKALKVLAQAIEGRKAKGEGQS